MTTVIVSTRKVAKTATRGGNFWVYMQYIQGLRRVGCDVYWMDEFRPRQRARENGGAVRPGDPAAFPAAATFLERARSFGLEGRGLPYMTQPDGTREWIGVAAAEAETAVRGADLMLNFHYGIDAVLLGWARRSALMDIDPGLLQEWMSRGELSVPPHDCYFSTGETVGTPRARFPDCGIRWIYSPPPVCLELWPVASDPACEVFTTVSGWWSGKWKKVVENGVEVLRENTKRAAFLPFVELPRHTSQPLELTLELSDTDVDERRMLEDHGWRITRPQDVASSPEMYRAYVQGSRGEWSAAKPSCMWLQNAWVSDRSLCYLASGKPVVVQDTGPSRFLPHGEGMFRFNTVAEAARALDAVNADYQRHCRAARELAETYFDAKKVVARMLDAALG